MYDTIEALREKVLELERRLELLEGGGSPSSQLMPIAPQNNFNRSASLIRAAISQKRYAPSNPHVGQYEEYIWFTVVYKPELLNKVTRAVKGVLDFTDLFGESKFRLNVTLNDRMEPNRPLIQEGIGFAYNQFMQAHQWMLATNEIDMKTEFFVTHIIYEDGSSEQLA